MPLRCRPDLLRLDAGLPGGESWNLLRQYRREQPGRRCIVFADDAEQVRKRRAVSTDAVFLKGFAAEAIVGTGGQLLFGHEEKSARGQS